ncbi:hypothetical protein [Parafrankia colletiae]|nr:hypothetical protein [Parafrankia colletiae]
MVTPDRMHQQIAAEQYDSWSTERCTVDEVDDASGRDVEALD